MTRPVFLPTLGQGLAIAGIAAVLAVTGACSGKSSSLLADDKDNNTRSVAPMSEEKEKAELCLENPTHPSCEIEDAAM
jgi:hypothetical protein